MLIYCIRFVLCRMYKTILLPRLKVGSSIVIFTVRFSVHHKSPEKQFILKIRTYLRVAQGVFCLALQDVHNTKIALFLRYTGSVQPIFGRYNYRQKSSLSRPQV